ETITLRGHTDHVWGLAFSPDGLRLASASGDRTLRIWNAIPPVPDDKIPFEVFALSLDAPDIHAIDLSPDGRWLAWAGEDPTQIDARETTRRQTVHTLRGHTKPISAMAFSRDGTHLAAVSEEAETLVVFDLTSGEAVSTLSTREDVGYAACLALSP